MENERNKHSDELREIWEMGGPVSTIRTQPINPKDFLVRSITVVPHTKEEQKVAVTGNVNEPVVLRIEDEKVLFFDQPLQLRPIPKRILSYLCGHPGKVVKRKTVMTAAGMGEPSVKAFKTHISAIRKAIKTATRKLQKTKRNQANKIASSLIECHRDNKTIILRLDADRISIS